MKKNKLKLLILEDCPSDAELMVRQLEREGFKIEWKLVDTEDTFKKALTEEPDLILADYHLPSYNGLEAIKLQQNIAPEIPLIVVSGSTGEAIAVECMRSGAVDYVLKDRLSMLSPVVKRVLKEIEEHKHIEEILHQSENNYKDLVQNANSIIMKMDTAGQITFLNEFAQTTFGFSNDEILGKNVIGSIVPETESTGRNLKEMITNVILHPDIFGTNENENLCKSGERIWVAWTNKGVFEKDGTPKGVLCIGTDITERKQVEEELKNSQERLKIIFEFAPDAFYLNDFKGTFIDGNKAAEDLMGYKKEELIGKSFLKLKILSAKELLKASKLLVKNARGKATGPSDFILNRKDGNQVSVEIRTYPVKIKDKSVVLGIARDITERKRAEGKEKEHYKKIELLSETAMRFVEFPQDKDIYTFIGEQLQEFAGKDSYIIVNSIDTVKNILTTRTVIGMGKLSEKVAGLLGKHPVGMTFDSKDEKLVYLSDGELHLYEEGMYGITLKTVPEAICKSIEKLLNIKRIYTIGFEKENELFGTVVIFLKEAAGELKNKQIIETFIKQASIAIQKRQAEEAFQESEEKYRKAFITSPDSININRLENGIYVSINNGFTQITGYSEDEVIGKTSLELDIWENPEDRKRLINGLKTEGLVKNFEAKFHTKNGKVLDGLMSAAVIELNGIPHIMSITRDITERKQVEESLHRYEHIISATGEHMSFIDRHYVYQAVNEAYLQAHQKAHQEIIGHSVADLLGADVFEQFVKEKLDRCLAGEEIHYQEWFDFPGLGRRYMDVAYYTYIEADGTKSGMVVSSRDITDRKQAEETLKESEQKFREMAELLPGLVYECDVQGNLIYVNKLSFDKFGYSQEDFKKGVNALQFIIPDDRKRATENIEKTLHGIEEGPFEYIAQRKDGSGFPVIIYSSPIVRDGKPVGLRGIIIDITERKKVEKIQKSLFNITNAANTTDNIQDLYSKIKESLEDVINTTNLFIALYDEKTDMISLPFFVDEKDHFKTFPAGKTLTNYVIKTGKPLFATNDVIEDLTAKGIIETIGSPSEIWLGVPLKVENKVVGIIAVQSYHDQNLYTEKDIKILEFVSGEIASAIERRQAEEILIKKNDELGIFNRLAVGRELRMIELKKEINELLKKQGEDAKYEIAE